MLGYCFLKLKCYTLSLRCYAKYLQFTWYLKDINEELFCYDSLGMLYYYKMDISKAKFYHMRFVNGRTVPINDERRDFAIECLLIREIER
jgi:hypothetical protein